VQVLSVPAKNRVQRGVPFTSSELSLYLCWELWKQTRWHFNILIQTLGLTDIHFKSLELHWNKRKDQVETDFRRIQWKCMTRLWMQCSNATKHSILHYFKRKELIYPTHTHIFSCWCQRLFQTIFMHKMHLWFLCLQQGNFNPDNKSTFSFP